MHCPLLANWKMGWSIRHNDYELLRSIKRPCEILLTFQVVKNESLKISFKVFPMKLQKLIIFKKIILIFSGDERWNGSNQIFRFLEFSKTSKWMRLWYQKLDVELILKLTCFIELSNLNLPQRNCSCVFYVIK